METSISAILVPCLKSFNQLAEQVELPDYDREAEVSPASWGDELGRLRVWAANIGAHQTGQSSLDFRLRDASHISNQITKLLENLEQSLCAIFDELSEHEMEASDEEDDAWPGHETTTELQQLYEEVVNIVDCLYQMSMLIRKPAQHDMLMGSRMGDLAHFEVYDQQHVRDLHPRAEEYIGQRLGRAITRRRKYLFYRERHHKKLEKGIEDVQGIQRATTGSVVSETIATDFKAPEIDFEETSLDSGMSQTSYAPSLIDGGRVTVPPPPGDLVGGKPFECPYCFFVIDIRSTRSWNRHLFKDIKPYVCTFPDCSMPDRLYDSRREWYYHETTEHGREGFVCSLCRETSESSKQYERHVARHLEELALFALPRTERDYAEDDNDDMFDARISTSHTDVACDSSSEGSSLEGEEGKAKVTAQPVPAAGPTLPLIIANAPPLTLDKSKDDEYSALLMNDTFNMQAYLPKLTPVAAAEPKNKPIKFKDAIGRRFNIPFNVCNTWSGMEYLIKEAFLHVADLGPHVAAGEYDLLGPKDEILMPSIWESVIEPGWEITMHMWPIPEPSEAVEPPLPSGENVDGKLLPLTERPLVGKRKKKAPIPPFMKWTAGKSKRAKGKSKRDSAGIGSGET